MSEEKYRIYKWSHELEKVVPLEEARAIEYQTQIINREIPPTKSPITGKIYTDASKLRAEYKAHGYTEVGNEFKNGYKFDKPDPLGKEWSEKTKRQLAERLG